MRANGLGSAVGRGCDIAEAAAKFLIEQRPENRQKWLDDFVRTIRLFMDYWGSKQGSKK